MSNYDVERPLPRRKNRNVTQMMKDKLGGQALMESDGVVSKACSYKKYNDREEEKGKGTQNTLLFD